MTTHHERLQVLYELSLAIGDEETLEATVDNALSAYLPKLGCSVGAVLERTDDCAGRYESVGGRPDGYEQDSIYRAARERLAERDTLDATASPVSGQRDDGHYYLMDLPGFGVLVLCTDGQELDAATISELPPLNEKLAEACQNRRVEAQLREERTRFEALFETMQEPLVNVVYEDGSPVVRRVNQAFEETFGYTEAELLGENVNDYIVPDDDPESREEAAEIDDMSANREFVTREVRRKTKDGMGDFLLRSVPVETATSDEQFGMYIDITEERTRQRKLEHLYRETEVILAGESREQICERMVQAAEEVIELSLAGINLYDRSEEALVSVANTSQITEVFDTPPESYSEQSIVWEVFQSGDPVKIDDIDAFEGRIPGGETPMQSTMIFPLGDHGVFVVSSLETDAFDEMDFQFARLLSTLVEVGLDRATREQGLEEVQELVRSVLDADDHEAVAERILAQIPDTLDHPIAGIWRYDSARERLSPLAMTEKADSLFETIPTFDAENSIAGRAFARGETQLVNDVEADESAYNPDSPIKSEIVAPLGDFGVLVTGSLRTSSFTETDRRIVETLASNVETVMRLVNRRQELELLDQVLARILRHNLRNDLTVIQGFAETIQDISNGEVEQQAERIVDRSEGLVATAEHAREMREIVRSSDETVPVSLQDAAKHAVSVARNEHPGANIELDVRPVPDVSAHPDLSTAIRHLIENGIEHDEADSPHVTVSVDGTEGGAVVEIADDGPGIPDGELDILSRHGESALEHGSGAGLWIVDRVVDYSDGTLEFETRDGTTARIRFEC